MRSDRSRFYPPRQNENSRRRSIVMMPTRNGRSAAASKGGIRPDGHLDPPNPTSHNPEGAGARADERRPRASESTAELGAASAAGRATNRGGHTWGQMVSFRRHQSDH